MSDLFKKAFDALWLKYQSIMVAWAIIILYSLTQVPNPPDTCTWVQCCNWGICFIIGVVYTIYVFKHNALPKGSDPLTSVLFIVDAESDQFYNDVEKKLISEFEDCKVIGNKRGFKAICIPKHRLKKFDFNNQNSMIGLLSKVNCMFAIFIKHRVDSVTSAENYEMQINYGIMHPTMNPKFVRLLEKDMRNLSKPIKKRQFKKAKNIDEMSFTAGSLSIITQYLIGFVMLLTENYHEAYKRLGLLWQYINFEKPACLIPGFDTVLKNRLYIACMGLIDLAFNSFYFDKNPKALEEFNIRLDELNTIVPETYRYYLNKAYYHVAKNSDVLSAKKCIAKCKSLNTNNTWRYSDAFIAAYEGRSPLSIYKKYASAFDVEQDLNQIGDFIEYILEREPDRHGLHLAAGLVYHELEEYQLSKEHLNTYLSETQNNRIKQLLQDKGIWMPEKVA